MTFGRLGALGAGFGRMGSERGGGSTPPAVWPAETNTIGPTTPATGTGGINGTTWVITRPIARSGTFDQAKIFASASGNVKIKVCRRSGVTITMLSEQTVAVTSGLNTIAVTPVAVVAGDFFAIYSATSNTLHFNSVTAPSGTEYYSTAGDMTTTLTVGAAALPTQTVRFEVNFRVTTAETTAAAAVGNLYYLGPKTPAAGSTPNIDTSVAYMEDAICPVDSRIETIDYHATVASNAQIFIMGPTSSGLALLRSFVVTFASGAHTLTAGVDFPIDVIVPLGGEVITLALMTGLSADNSFLRSARVLDAASTTGLFPPAALNFGGTSPDTSANAQIRINLRRTAAIPRSTTKLDQTFTVIPLDFTATGWSIVSSKARNSGTGLANSLAWRRGTYGDGKTSVWVTFSGATDEVAVFRKPRTTGDNLGTIFTVKADTKRLAFRDLWDGSNTLGAVTTSKTSTITFTTGVEYQIDVEKTGTLITATVTDGVTTDTLAFNAHDGTTAYSLASGLAIGMPGFASIAGTVDVSRMRFTSVANPGAIMFGDSITETSGTLTYPAGFAYQIAAALSGGGIVSGMSGTASTGILARIEWELRQFYPRDVLVLIGTNDTVTATWQANITEIKSRIEACGGIPWFGAVPAEAADSNPELIMNPFLRSNYPSTVISFDQTLTLPHTGLGADRNAALYTDTIHPNNAGHAAMFTQVQTDAPSLFT